LAILVLSAAVLYVAWRNSQIRKEMRAIRSLVDASVSLHELEEQVMPAIDTLEKEAARLKREMQQLARATASKTQLRRGETPAAHAERTVGVLEGDDDYQSEEDEEEEDAVEGDRQDVPCDAGVFAGRNMSPELSLLVGSLLSSAPPSGATGIPMARVLLSAGQPAPITAGPIITAIDEDDASAEDAASKQRGEPLVKSVSARLLAKQE
jgi:hypothetical protein